jgi:hypothetical protein
VGLSLRFALHLDPFNPASPPPVPATGAVSPSRSLLGMINAGWEGKPRGLARPFLVGDKDERKSASPRGEATGTVLDETFPPEIIAHILHFFQVGRTAPAPFSLHSLLTLPLWVRQCETDDLPEDHPGRRVLTIPMRREAVKTVLAIRLVSRHFSHLATDLIAAIRVGEMEEITTAKHRAVLMRTILSCRNLRNLCLRNLDTLTDDEVVQFGALTRLRYINLGGCSRITDTSSEVLAALPLAHLNISVTRITDYGLSLLGEAAAAKVLTTLTLYGIVTITEGGSFVQCMTPPLLVADMRLSFCSSGGIRALVASLPHLTSINVRGTGISFDGGQRIKNSALCKSCQVLTGPGLLTSVYTEQHQPHA